MEEKDVKRLNIDSLFSSQIVEDVASDIDETTYQLTKISNELSTNDEIKSIIDKYNEKYHTTLKYDSLENAIETSLAAKDADLANAVVNNSIVASVDYTMFNLIVLACKQINGLITDMMESQYIEPEKKVAILDRIFLWIQRLENTKNMYSNINIDKLIKKNLGATKDPSTKLAVTKILEAMRL